MSSNTSQRLAALSDEQKQLLAQRLSRQRSRRSSTIPRRAQTTAQLPLSFAQQRFWLLNQLGATNTAYNCYELHRLSGPLDIAVLGRSLSEIARRHEGLRATFVVEDGVPQQRIHPPLGVPLQVDDLRALPDAEREAQRRLQLGAEAQRPWDLANGPLIRARVWRLGDEDHQLLVIMHHIVSDGWSLGVLIDELARLYHAFSQGKPSPLPELPIQYGDFAVWQREWATGDDFDRQIAYWKGAMRQPPVLQLPAIRTGQPASTKGTHKRFFIEPAMMRDLRTLCQAEGITVFMALLSLFAVLLSRYSGQDDVVIGTPVANRDRPELEHLIGCFMNPLPIRNDLGGNPTFRTLLRRVRTNALATFANQNVPFDVLVRAVGASRDSTNTPLFQVMFLLQNFGVRSLQMSAQGLGTRTVASMDEMAIPADYEVPGDLTYPVALEALEVGPMLAASIEYAPEYAPIFSRFPGHMRTLMAALVSNPDTRIGEAPWLTAEESGRLLVEWNHEVLPADGVCVHELFEREAASRPAAPAVIFNEARISYGELNARADALASRLRAAGAGADVPVGILLDRSIEMVVAVLAVMKSGGCYVPLDSAYPADRLRFIMEDAALRVLISTRATLERIPELLADAAATRCHLEFIDEEPSASAASDTPPEPVQVDAARLAYIIYTSGSTGRPKGTMVTHASLAGAYRAWEREYELRSLKAHLQMASLSFDVFSGDLARALCSGAALVIAPQELLFEPARLLALIEREQVDAAEFVPVVLRDLVRHLETSGQTLAGLRLLAAGSDSWYNQEYTRLVELCGPETRVVNSYGLTEATIDSTYFDGNDSELAVDGLVPLGRAFPGTEVLLLDSRMQLVPVGVPAEIMIGGAGLARGYLNRPDLTAERFIPHPFSTTAGARLYRTGDLGRYLPDGTLELLGRTDQQVKLRGFRIELAEVESVLGSHSTIDSAVALVREDSPGDRRLVAYVVAAPGATVNASELRRFARETVPDYMVPSSIVVMPAFPLTPNGKVDRLALPAPDGERQSEEAFVAPRTEIERRLATIWSGVLRVDQVGLNDNFFDLGGHSLLIVQLHARVVSGLDRPDLTVVDLFRFPTVAALAQHLSVKKDPARAEFASARQRAQRNRSAVRRPRQGAVLGPTKDAGE